MEEGRNHQDIAAQPASVPIPASSNMNVFSVVPFPVTFAPVPMETSVLDQSNSSPMLVHQGPVCPFSTMADLNVNKEIPSEPSSPLSLRLSLATGHDQSDRGFSIEMSSSFKNGDSIISVV